MAPERALSIVGPAFFGGGGGVAYSSWNPADKDADITLSSGNALATITSALGAVRGAQGRAATEDRYFEARQSSSGVPPTWMIGVGNASATLTNYPGFDVNGWAWYETGRQKYNNNTGAAYATSGWLGVEYNSSTGTLTFWRGGVSIGAAYTGLSGTLFPMWGPGTGGAGTRTATANFGASAFIYGLPPGASAWDATATWNSADKDADITLSAGDLVASITTATGSVRATTGRSSGHYYFEVLIAGADLNHITGVGNASATLTSYPGFDANSWAYSWSDLKRYNNNTGVAYQTPTAFVGVRVNAGALSFVIDGVNQGAAFTGLTGTLYPMWGPGSSGTAFESRLNTGGSALIYGLPSGASVWG